MPFVSEDQRHWMWANEPELARKWEEEEKAKKKDAEDRRSEKQKRREGKK
jgi:hypothetical protein